MNNKINIISSLKQKKYLEYITTNTRIIFLLIIIGIFIRIIPYFFLSERTNYGYVFYSLIDSISANFTFEINANPDFYFAPLFFYIYGLFNTIIKINYFTYTIIQALLSGIFGFVIYHNINEIVGKRVAFFSLIMYLFYPYYFISSSHIIDTLIFMIFFYLFIFNLIKYYKFDYKLKYLVFTSLFLGITMLVRATVLFLVMAIPIFLIFNSKINIKKRIIHISTFCLVFLIILLPWIFRNYKLTGDIFLSPRGGEALYYGNNINAYKCLKNNISLDKLDPWKNNSLSLSVPDSIVAGRCELSYNQMKKYYSWQKTEVIEFIKNNPV